MYFFEQNICYILKIIMKTMIDLEEIDEFVYEFHERVLGITLGLLEEEEKSIKGKIEQIKNNA